APLADPIAARKLEALAVTARDFGLELFDLRSPQQGIVHVIGPELGLTQPGMVIVCGDSHTATHGAFGALALGIGTSEVEHVLATQRLVCARPATMEAHVTGSLADGVTAKDLILALIGRIGTAGATGHVIEYTGTAIRARSNTWDSPPGLRSKASPSIGYSSAPAPMPASKTCEPRPGWCAATGGDTSLRACGRWSCRDRNR